MLERHLIEYCSPTLASLKTASLFRLPYTSEERLWACVIGYSRYFSRKGVTIKILEQNRHSALIYVYREKKLLADLEKPGVTRFLTQLGYQYETPGEAIDCLISRFQEMADFPHEIGLFLGYPLWDVYGFIHHRGQNSKCTGHWKVYCHEHDAKKLFERFNKCKHIYQRLWQEGRPIIQLTVAV